MSGAIALSKRKPPPTKTRTATPNMNSYGEGSIAAKALTARKAHSTHCRSGSVRIIFAELLAEPLATSALRRTLGRQKYVR